MKKQLKVYFKEIKKNLPCYNKAMKTMLGDLRLSVDAYIKDNNITDFEKIIEHFGTAEDIAKEFAVGLDNSYVKSYKLKKRIIAIVVSVLAAILAVVVSLALYIFIENELHSPSLSETTVKYEYSEEYEK